MRVIVGVAWALIGSGAWAGPFPMPDIGERWTAYAARWDAWASSLDPSDRAWVDLLGIHRELTAATETGTLVLSGSEDDAAREANGRFLAANPGLFPRLHEAALRPALGMTSGGNHDPDHAAHLRMLGQEPPSEFDGVLAGSTLSLTTPQTRVLHDQCKYVLLVMQDAIERDDRRTVVACFDAIAGLAGLAQEPPTSLHFLIGAAALNGAIEQVRHLSEYGEADLAAIARSVEQIRRAVDLSRSVRFESFMSRDMLEWIYEGSGDSGRLTEAGRARLKSLLVQVADLGGDAASRQMVDAMVTSAADRGEQISLHALITDALLRDAGASLHQVQRLGHSDLKEEYRPGGLHGFDYAGATLLIPDWARCFEFGCSVGTRANATLLFLACHRHRVRHGVFPASIQSIDADLMGFEPIDLYSGSPLMLRLVDGQPLIWSTGPDRVDDQASKQVGSDRWIPLDALGEMGEAERAEIRGDIVYFGGP